MAFVIDRGNVNSVVFLDLKKAFDTVDHTILLSKLSTYGIQENAYNWFKSYLENRTQICSVSGSLSKTCSLQGGIPQGTILGPLLFLLYINDLPNCLTNSYPRVYDHDTHLTNADKDVNIIQSCLNEDLLNISKWLIANKLSLNMTNTEVILIGSRQKLTTLTASPALSIKGIPVNQVSTSKSLGVLIVANLTWGSHIDMLAKINCLWYCSYKTGQAICSPSNIASYLQSLDSVAFRLLQCRLGKLWHKTSRQTSKTPKSCSASSNSLKP